MDSLLKENLTLCVRTVEPQTPYHRLAEELFGMAAEADEWAAKIEATRPKKK